MGAHDIDILRRKAGLAFVVEKIGPLHSNEDMLLVHAKDMLAENSEMLPVKDWKLAANLILSYQIHLAGGGAKGFAHCPPVPVSIRQKLERLQNLRPEAIELPQAKQLARDSLLGLLASFVQAEREAIVMEWDMLYQRLEAEKATLPPIMQQALPVANDFNPPGFG